MILLIFENSKYIKIYEKNYFNKHVFAIVFLQNINLKAQVPVDPDTKKSFIKR